MKLSIIIPVFNENKTIVQLLSLIEKQIHINKQIIIVDDCSSDNSIELIEKFKFKSDHTILKHDRNRGKGSCIKTAKKIVNGVENLKKWFNFKFEVIYFYNVYGPKQIKKVRWQQ